MLEKQAIEAAKQAAVYDKKLDVFDDEPCMGCDTEEVKQAYRTAYREINPPKAQS